MARIIQFPKKKKSKYNRYPYKFLVLNDTKDHHPWIYYQRRVVLKDIAKKIRLIWSIKRKRQLVDTMLSM